MELLPIFFEVIMIPQGSTLINTDHFANIIASINGAQTCDELQGFVTSAMASVNTVKANITAELDKLTPILALASPPGASPGAIVSWITDFISLTLTPMIKPTITYAAQLTETLTQIAGVVSAIEAAAERIPSCSITIPS
jgi:hypothetical protein